MHFFYSFNILILDAAHLSCIKFIVIYILVNFWLLFILVATTWTARWLFKNQFHYSEKKLDKKKNGMFCCLIDQLRCLHWFQLLWIYCVLSIWISCKAENFSFRPNYSEQVNNEEQPIHVIYNRVVAIYGEFWH